MQEAAHERGLASGLPQRPRRSYEWAGENNGRSVISAIFARARGSQRVRGPDRPLAVAGRGLTCVFLSSVEKSRTDRTLVCVVVSRLFDFRTYFDREFRGNWRTNLDPRAADSNVLADLMSGRGKSMGK